MYLYYRIRNWIFILLSIAWSPIIFSIIHWRARRKSDGQSPRILVVPQFTRIGDVVCATPVFRAIKKQYPKSFIAVVVHKKTAGILKNNPHIDEIILYGYANFFDVIRRIRLFKFDWSFCLSGSSIGTLMAWWGLIPDRVKLTRSDRPPSELLTDWLNNYRFFYMHHTYLPGHYLKMLSVLSISDPEEVKEVFLSSGGEQKVERFLKENRINKQDVLVGISITAGNKIKEWGDDKFTELAQRIVAKYNAKIVFIGGRSDDARISSLLKNLSKKYYFQATDFSLEELPSLIKRLSLYVAVDTGPIYIAHALKTPLIDIIGPVDPREQPPHDGRSVQLLPGSYIKPTSFVFKKPRRGVNHKIALDSISVGGVMEGVERLVSGAGPLNTTGSLWESVFD